MFVLYFRTNNKQLKIVSPKVLEAVKYLYVERLKKKVTLSYLSITTTRTKWSKICGTLLLYKMKLFAKMETKNWVCVSDIEDEHESRFDAKQFKRKKHVFAWISWKAQQFWMEFRPNIFADPFSKKRKFSMKVTQAMQWT